MKKFKFKLTLPMGEYVTRIARNTVETGGITSLIVGKLSGKKDHFSLMVVLLCEGVFRSVYAKSVIRGTIKTLSLTQAELVAMHYLFLHSNPGDNIFANQELVAMFDKALLSL